jgi:hypothetical protein
LLGEAGDGSKCVLRFNIKAFRNNYGLTDISRMRLVFHGILVGGTSELSLSIEAEMSHDTVDEPVTALELVDGMREQSETLLDVYDVLLAGVEHVE